MFLSAELVVSIQNWSRGCDWIETVVNIFFCQIHVPTKMSQKAPLPPSPTVEITHVTKLTCSDLNQIGGDKTERPPQGMGPNSGPATAQNLVVQFDGEICSGVLVEIASDDFPQQKKLENLVPNFAGSSPPISPKTSPTSLWKSLVLTNFPHITYFPCDPVQSQHAFLACVVVTQPRPSYASFDSLLPILSMNSIMILWLPLIHNFSVLTSFLMLMRGL